MNKYLLKCEGCTHSCDIVSQQLITAPGVGRGAGGPIQEAGFRISRGARWWWWWWWYGVKKVFDWRRRHKQPLCLRSELHSGLFGALISKWVAPSQMAGLLFWNFLEKKAFSLFPKNKIKKSFSSPSALLTGTNLKCTDRFILLEWLCAKLAYLIDVGC